MSEDFKNLRRHARLWHNTIPLTVTILVAIFTSQGNAQSTTAVEIAAGWSHTCAVMSDGAVRCWGGGGAIGNGTQQDAPTPSTVPGVSTATAVSSYPSHTCVVLSDGTARCWGSNDSGQLGDGSTTSALSPVVVNGITSATTIAGGSRYTCAVLADGTVRCWGNNDTGQLGDGTTTASLAPVTVTGISTAMAVTAGANHTCALLSDGTVRCWGGNFYGAIGDGTTNNSLTPVAVTGISTATAVVAGTYHTCARLSDGAVKCWGLNAWGQIGDGSTGNSFFVPTAVPGITTAVTVAAHYAQSCAVLADGTARCWGDNDFGQLGNGSTIDSAVPVTVSGISTATAVTTGFDHTCVLLGDGSVWCWGRNVSGQLGDGTGTDSSVPVEVLLSATENTHFLRVFKQGSGTGTVTSTPPGIDCGPSCIHAFDEDSMVTLSAVADGGSTFQGWSGSGTGCSGTALCTVTMTDSKNVFAQFGVALLPPRLSNISTRGFVQTGDNVMIGGFVIQGSIPKAVLVRARGRSLAAFGVSGVMTNPYIELYSGSTKIAQNDNWQTTDPLCGSPAVACGNAVDIQNTGRSPCSVTALYCGSDSAIHVTLPPGPYTAILRGVGGGTGVGIVETIDLDGTTEPKLVNTSTRGLVLTGDGVMIGGFVVGTGGTSKTLLIRVRGPSLAAFGVAGVMANPYVELYSGSTLIAQNSDWQTTDPLCGAPAVACGTATDIQNTGKDPCSVTTTSCTLDSAIYITLPAGPYTAIVRGVGGGTGVGIVEVIDLSP